MRNAPGATGVRDDVLRNHASPSAIAAPVGIAMPVESSLLTLCQIRSGGSRRKLLASSSQAGRAVHSKAAMIARMRS